MKRTAVILLCLMYLCIIKAQPAITFTPTWTPQAQFAGYYAAIEKGYFKEEGLNVRIKHLKVGSKKTACDMLIDGETDIVSISLMKAIQMRDQGLKLVNVLQVSQNTGLMCVSTHKLTDLSQLNGKTVGTWKAGYREIAEFAFTDKNINIKWIPFLQGMNLFVAKAVDATLCYNYNEYIQLIMAKGHIPKENCINFSDIGYNFPEDGIYVTEEYYKAHHADVVKFVRACKKGWNYCRSNPDDALNIVMKYTKLNNIVTNTYHQRIMLKEILRLQQDYSSYAAHVDGISTFAPVSKTTFGKAVKQMQKIGMIKNDIRYDDMIKIIKD